MEVPDEFRSEFTRDILSAIRDIAGSATFALHPFIVNTEAVAKAFGVRQSVLSTQETDFVARPSIYPTRILRPEEPRLAHVDLGLTGDSAGVAVGWVEGFAKVARSDNTFEMMPVINLDLILEVKPPQGGEIEFENIRTLFYKLREVGMNLKWISFDTFQSADSIQLLRQKGFTTGTYSMDTTSIPYDFTKSAFYDGRIKAPVHDKALSEMMRLERNPQSGLIDHPPNFSKDCSGRRGWRGVRSHQPPRDLGEARRADAQHLPKDRRQGRTEGQEIRAGTSSLSLIPFGLAVTSRFASFDH